MQKSRLVDSEKFGPWAVVTGASSGIGREFAQRLAGHGLNLVLASRRRQELDALAAELTAAHGVACRVVGVDLSREGAGAALDEATRDLDVGLLVSNAGAGAPGGFLAAPHERLQAHFRLNALAHLDLAHYFGQRLQARGRGGILFAGALGASQGIPLMANDGAAKAYVQSFAEALNVEFRRLAVNINVTVLIVGPTATPVIEQFFGSNPTLPLQPMSVEQVVTEGLVALQQNRASIVPGAFLRLVFGLVPSSLIRRMNARMFSTAIRTT